MVNHVFQIHLPPASICQRVAIWSPRKSVRFQDAARDALFAGAVEGMAGRVRLSNKGSKNPFDRFHEGVPPNGPSGHVVTSPLNI
jgi:hypothetical protein